MKVITLSELETNFDAIMEDVETNRQFYKIQREEGDVMLVPYVEYEVLTETYQEWAENPDNEIMKDFDPNPLPVEYINEAEPTL
jgi:PHD/YefM family antitoxin component YafN of YafNO toxin-antitoxin module